MPKTKDELDEALEKFDTDYSGVVSSIEEVLQDFANMNAAMAWSTAGDELEGKYGEVWVLASFGSAVAVNGDPVQGAVPSAPKGYVLTREGGDIPVVEEEVPVEQAIYAVSEAQKIPRALVEEVAAAEGMKELAYISVSGEAEVWAKKGK